MTFYCVLDKSTKPFVASFKEKQGLWAAILEEMTSGKQVSVHMRDPTVVDLAAGNVLLIDALHSWSVCVYVVPYSHLYN